MTLSGTNDNYSGGTIINAGTLIVGNSTVLGTGGVVISAGTLDLDGNGVTVPSLSGATNALGAVTNNGAADATLTVNQSVLTLFPGRISDGLHKVALTKSGNGTLVLASNTNSNNTYSGGTTVNAGLLILGNNNSLGTGGLAMAGGTLDLAGNNPTVASLGGTSGGLVTNVTNQANQQYQGPATLTVNQSGNTTFGGQIADDYNTVALVKQGNGMLTLASANAYCGGTTVQAGKLQLAAAGALGTGALAVNGGTLDLDGLSVTVPSFSGAGGARHHQRRGSRRPSPSTSRSTPITAANSPTVPARSPWSSRAMAC